MEDITRHLLLAPVELKIPSGLGGSLYGWHHTIHVTTLGPNLCENNTQDKMNAVRYTNVVHIPNWAKEIKDITAKWNYCLGISIKKLP